MLVRDFLSLREHYLVSLGGEGRRTLSNGHQVVSNL